MIEKSIRYVAVIVERLRAASASACSLSKRRVRRRTTTRTEIAASGPNAEPAGDGGRGERASEHSQVRRTIDDVNEEITSPFAGLVSEDDNIWAQRGVPAVLALLCFGVGLGFLARYTQGRAE